jgi:hypothetical protein
LENKTTPNSWEDECPKLGRRLPSSTMKLSTFVYVMLDKVFFGSGPAQNPPNYHPTFTQASRKEPLSGTPVFPGTKGIGLLWSAFRLYPVS